jgi:hypothetical protein
VDSNPLAAQQFGSVGTSLNTKMQGTLASFPYSQDAIPPVVVFSTITAYGQFSNMFNVINLTDSQGNGLAMKNGIVVLKSGTDYGTVISVRYRAPVYSFGR